MRSALKCLLVFAGLVASALSPGPALAQIYPPAGPTAGASDTSVVPGQEITVGGSGWEQGSQVDLEWLSTPVDLGRAEVTRDGTFSTAVGIPQSRPGEHTIQVGGRDARGKPLILSVRIVLLRPGEAAFSGADIGVWAAMAGSLLALGFGSLVFGGRRSTAGHRLEKT